MNIKSCTLILTFQPNLHAASAGSGRFIKSARLQPPTVRRFTLFVCRAAECLLEVPRTPSLREPMELKCTGIAAPRSMLMHPLRVVRVARWMERIQLNVCLETKN